MRTRIATLLAALTLAVGGALVSSVEYTPPPGPGSADVRPVVFGCRAWKTWPDTAHANCDGGVGGVRAVADCWYPVYDYQVRVYGPYVGAGPVSSAVVCSGGSYVVSASYQAYGF